MTMTQAPPLFPPSSSPPSPEQAQRTRELQAHYRAQHETVKETRSDERKRIAERDATGKK
jgi:hypothetical protein